MSISKTYDIHIASDVISPRLEKELLAVGFLRDAFIGGTTGVVHPCHYSSHPATHDEMLTLWQRAIPLLQKAEASEFHGYAEAEFTPPRYRVELPWKDFDPSARFPLGRFDYDACPLDQHKDFDVHVTADTARIDPRLQRLFEEEINFNYVEIRKPLGKVVRVYTFQPLGEQVTHGVFDVLLDYCEKAGGLDGKIKLEVCTHFARFPKTAAVCPIVRKLAPPGSGY